MRGNFWGVVGCAAAALASPALAEPVSAKSAARQVWQAPMTFQPRRQLPGGGYVTSYGSLLSILLQGMST